MHWMLETHFHKRKDHAAIMPDGMGDETLSGQMVPSKSMHSLADVLPSEATLDTLCFFPPLNVLLKFIESEALFLPLPPPS